MFWRKETHKQPVRFLKLNIPGFLGTTSYPAYRNEEGEDAKRLAFYEDVERLEEKLNLILDHLKLRYVPEKETKEPAKLEEKLFVGTHTLDNFITHWDGIISGGGAYVSDCPTKKRKYVKSGKYSKKNK